MLIIAAAWIAIFVLVVLLGTIPYFLYVRFVGNDYCPRTNLFQLAWLGYAFLIAFLQFFSVFLPINGKAVITLCIIPIVGLIFFHRYLKNVFKHITVNFPNKKIIYLAGVILILAGLSCCSSMRPLVHYDTQLYHLNAVKWASTYPAIPGIVNLHGRLAFNSSFHLFAALTNTWIFEDSALSIANSFLLLLATVQWFTYIVNISKIEISIKHAFVIVTFPFLMVAGFLWGFPSLSTDLPFHILSLVTILELLSMESELHGSKLRYDAMNSENLFSWFVILSLASVAFTTKLAGAPLLILLPVSLYFVISSKVKNLTCQFSFRNLLVLYVLPLFIILGFISRNIILSGWLIYPVPTSNLHLDWSASPEQVINEFNSVRMWARMPGFSLEEFLGGGFFNWFIPWFMRFLNNYLAIFLLIIALSGLFYLGLLKVIKKSEVSISFPLALSILIGIIGLAYWFVSAPQYRFGEGYFWIFAGTASTPLFLTLTGQNRRRYFITVLIMLVIVFTLRSMQGETTPLHISKDLFIFPPKAPERAVVPVVIKNGQIPPLVIFKPISSNLCENSPLPCSPYISENSPIRLRIPGDIGSGFIAMKNISLDMHH